MNTDPYEGSLSADVCSHPKTVLIRHREMTKAHTCQTDNALAEWTHPTGKYLCMTQGPFRRPKPPLHKRPSPNHEVYLNQSRSAPVSSLERAAGETTMGGTMTIHIKYIFMKFPQQWEGRNN